MPDDGVVMYGGWHVSLDKFIGHRLRELRTNRSQPPEKVAAYLSVPLDVYSAFELGRKPIAAGHLYDLCIFFDVKVTYFFDGYEKGPGHPFDEGSGDRNSTGSRG